MPAVTRESRDFFGLLFKNISTAKPAADLFAPPTDYTKYTDVQTMVMTEMQKHIGNMAIPGKN